MIDWLIDYVLFRNNFIDMGMSLGAYGPWTGGGVFIVYHTFRDTTLVFAVVSDGLSHLATWTTYSLPIPDGTYRSL